MGNEIFVIQFWPEYQNAPEIICAATSRVDAEEMVLSLWQGSGYETYLRNIDGELFHVFDFSFYQDRNFAYDFDFVETKVI